MLAELDLVRKQLEQVVRQTHSQVVVREGDMDEQAINDWEGKEKLRGKNDSEELLVEVCIGKRRVRGRLITNKSTCGVILRVGDADTYTKEELTRLYDLFARLVPTGSEVPTGSKEQGQNWRIGSIVRGDPRDFVAVDLARDRPSSQEVDGTMATRPSYVKFKEFADALSVISNRLVSVTPTPQ